MLSTNLLISGRVLNSGILLLASGLLLGVGIVLLATNGPAAGSPQGALGEYSFELVPSPTDLAAVTADAELIVLGVVTSRGRQETELFPPVKTDDVPIQAELPFAYYDFRADDVIASEFGVKVGDTISIRVSGTIGQDVAFDGRMVMPKIGDERLLVVRRHRDGESYGVDTFSIFDLSGDSVTFGDRNATSIEYLTSDTRRRPF